MNRAERRAAAKKGVSPAAILAKDRQDTKVQVTKEATAFAVRGLAAAFMVVLHDKYGFGQKRLQRVIEEVNGLFDSITDGYVSLEEVEQTIKDEFHIDLK